MPSFPNYPRRWRDDDDREDVESSGGTITFNWLQQHPEGFDPSALPTPVEEAGTTDPWGLRTTTTVVDDFNRANESPLASPWSSWYGAPMNLASNQIEPVGDWAGVARLGDVFADGEMFVTVTGPYVDLYIRVLPDFAGGYALGIAEGWLGIWRADLVGSPVIAEMDHTPVAGNRYKLSAVGDRISASVDTGSGWEEVMEVTDTVYPGPGFVALDAYPGVKLDDFGVGVDD